MIDEFILNGTALDTLRDGGNLEIPDFHRQTMVIIIIKCLTSL